MRLKSTALCLTLSATFLLGGCTPLLLGGAAVSGALAVTDRRTSGAQVEDQGIELKAGSRLSNALGKHAHVSATSYNRTLLLTGEVATEADFKAATQAVQGIENLRSVVNELAVMPASSVSSRSTDLVLVSKVKASYVDAKDMQANAIKVVAERGIIYLMGRVTEREAVRAADIAAGVSGVKKVVRVFEMLSEEELKALQNR